MARPKKQAVKTGADDKQEAKSPFRIVESGGKFVFYHGGNVRQVFMTRAKAEEYLDWCKG